MFSITFQKYSISNLYQNKKYNGKEIFFLLEWFDVYSIYMGKSFEIGV
jgi:hypothetical protein